MKAVTILAANPPDWASITLGRSREYAARIGAEFILIEPKEWHGMLDKQLFRDVVASHDQTLVLDLDIVVSRAAPSLLGMCSEDTVWMAPDYRPTDTEGRDRLLDIATIQAMLGSIRWVSGYGNMGVVVAGQVHADAWTNWVQMPVRLFGQTNFNYRLRQLGIKVGWLHRNWNSMYINTGVEGTPEYFEEIARGAFFAHAAGIFGEDRKAAIEVFDRVLP